MKPLFTVHEGEFLVGDHINRNFGKKYEVWIPAKDTGVDLLLTPTRGQRKPIKLQVKFSRSFGVKEVPPDQSLARRWYTLKPTKIRQSRADLWIFVILTLRHQPYYILIPTADLKRRIPRGSTKVWHLYLTAFVNKKCYNTRGLRASDVRASLLDGVQDPHRDFSRYLNSWNLLDKASR